MKRLHCALFIFEMRLGTPLGNPLDHSDVIILIIQKIIKISKRKKTRKIFQNFSNSAREIPWVFYDNINTSLCK